MKRLLAALSLSLLLCVASDSKSSGAGGFPQTVRVRLWYLHPPRELRLRAEPGQAQLRKCATCKPIPVVASTLRAAGSQIQTDGDKSATTELRISGTYQMNSRRRPSSSCRLSARNPRR